MVLYQFDLLIARADPIVCPSHNLGNQGLSLHLSALIFDRIGIDGLGYMDRITGGEIPIWMRDDLRIKYQI